VFLGAVVEGRHEGENDVDVGLPKPSIPVLLAHADVPMFA
jgi:hypothetical protein